MSEYREIRGSLQGERCEHKSWADLCERCEIARIRAENERLDAELKAARDELGRWLCGVEIKEMQKEIERLRAALREYECHCPTSVCEWFPCGKTARNALEERP